MMCKKWGTAYQEIPPLSDHRGSSEDLLGCQIATILSCIITEHKPRAIARLTVRLGDCLWAVRAAGPIRNRLDQRPSYP